MSSILERSSKALAIGELEEREEKDVSISSTVE